MHFKAGCVIWLHLVAGVVYGVWLSRIGWVASFCMHVCHSAGLAEAFLISVGCWLAELFGLVSSCPACYWLDMNASLVSCPGLIRLA
ncbi:hypothetical protein NC651_003431 [Populus alba x Populus x berolinensis]|nr:hypothetical protein NC651_003431 [Populus alba x Populus x berolinensis]